MSAIVYEGGRFSTPCQILPKPCMRAIVRLALEPLLLTQKTNWGTTWNSSKSSAIWSTCFLISGASKYLIGIVSLSVFTVIWTLWVNKFYKSSLCLFMVDWFASFGLACSLVLGK